MARVNREQKNQALIIHKALMVFQYKNRFVGSAYEQECDLLESHILSEIDAAGVSRFSEVVNHLGLGKSLIARRMAELESSGFVRSKANAKDRRVADLRLTESGRSLLRSLDSVANPLMREHCSPFSASELKSFARLVNRFAEQVTVPPSRKRKGDYGLRAEMRTLARAMGVVGRNFMGSGASSTHWQMLTYLSLSSRLLSIQELASLVGFSHGATSKALTPLTRDGLVRKVSGADRRENLLEVTKSGYSYLADIDDTAVRHVLNGMKDFTKAERSRFTELISRLAFGDPDESSLPLGYGYSYRRAKRASDLSSLRRFLITNIADVSDYPISDTLFSDNNLCVSLLSENEICGAAEVVTSTKAALLINFFVSHEVLNPLVPLQFVAQTLRVLATIQTDTLDVSRFSQTLSTLEQANLFHFCGRNRSHIRLLH